MPRSTPSSSWCRTRPSSPFTRCTPSPRARTPRPRCRSGSKTRRRAAALDLLVDAARPRADDVSLDVACGPGSVVCAFARRVRRAVGLDATEAMLAQARQLAADRALDNVAWHRGDVYALPFADGVFDV